MTEMQAPPKISVVHRLADIPANFLHRVFTFLAGLKLLSRTGKGVSSVAGWIYVLSGAKHALGAILLSARTPSVLVVYGIVVLGAYLFGHHEESKVWAPVAVKLKAELASNAAFAKEIADLKSRAFPVCAPAPAAVPQSAAAGAAPRAKVRGKRKAPSGFLSGF